MHKKTTLFLSLSFILVLSILNNVNIQGASAQSIVDQESVYMVGLQLQLKQTNNDYYSKVNTSTLPQVQNLTEARFIASFVNKNASAAILQTFKVYFYNSTTPNVADQTLTLSYDQNSPAKIQVPTNGSYTEDYQQPLPFKLLDQAYSLQYQFQFVFTSNTTKEYIVNSPINFSLESQLPLYSPPEFIIWFWWGINGVLVIFFALGWYGNRKTKRKNNSK